MIIHWRFLFLKHALVTISYICYTVHSFTVISLLLPVLVNMATRQSTLKFSGVKQLFTLLSDSVGQQFRQGTAGLACVCSVVSPTSAERLEPKM